MRQARTFGWLRFFHAAALCVLAAPALAAPRDDVNLISLMPPSGTLVGVSNASTPLTATNSVEATISYRLQSAATANRGIISIHGYPMVPPTYPTTMSPGPNIVSAGGGRIRVRFSLICAPSSPPTVALSQVRYFLGEIDATTRLVRIVVEKLQPVSYTFTCRPPSQIKRPSDAALTTPGESPMQRLDPQAQGSLRPDLVPILTRPMTGAVIVRNIGAVSAPASTLSVSCNNYTAKNIGYGCPTTIFPLQRSDGVKYVLIEIPSLAPGAEHVVNLRPWPSTWPAGRYSFSAIADRAIGDPLTRVSESNENNNGTSSYLDVAR